MFRFIILIIVFLISNRTFASDFGKYLINPPQQLVEKEDCQAIEPYISAQLLGFFQSMEKENIVGNIELIYFLNYKSIDFDIKIDSMGLESQAYALKINPNKIELIGQNWAALFYGKQTLIQLLQYSIEEEKPLPCLEISDWPNFERRGYMLDVSRDKVPTMESLYQLIDLLAKWKINELQLYTEHTFAYKNHRKVWENSSPLTAKEIQLLDKYCKESYIDLVPNQNSFGHMENWLKHEEYLSLAECPTDCDTKWGKRKRTSLDPTNPQSFELMKELYAELLPNFSSPYFNIGGDETIELCTGKSQAECERIGKGTVYLNYLSKLNAEVNKQGKLAQFWGDIILNHPELIKEIPKNMTALVWGYDDVYPFDKNLPKFKEAGLEFYVCPGTSTWRSLIGRNQNAFINLKNAAIEGRKNKAKGYLNTNWGDYGHWQPLSVVYPTMLIGASYAWNYDEKTLENLEFQLNHYVFKDKTGNTGKAILKLGNAYLKTNIPNGNANAFHLMLRRYKWTMKGQYQTKELSNAGLLSAKKEIEEALDLFEKAKPATADSVIIKDEIKQAASLAIHGINLGLARLEAKDNATENISADKKQKLFNELQPLIENHKNLWTIRNRKGGLVDSSSKLEDLLNYYEIED
ncbi:beta-N-acetylhexosaminidase [Xanthovirga aplysinae]|uniref:beta-N-acetylhexosaminidase n=1 Tax=Xanthovirga aplysinae TaxID=2529853 RepID=UPI0012BC60C1|nr:family 20 glycosylhydrolase [Xanthovirga aplysinae]MTI31009.1 beta-hexosaminidase [Xanthovirga aplysinae]